MVADDRARQAPRAYSRSVNVFGLGRRRRERGMRKCVSDDLCLPWSILNVGLKRDEAERPAIEAPVLAGVIAQPDQGAVFRPDEGGDPPIH